MWTINSANLINEFIEINDVYLLLFVHMQFIGGNHVCTMCG